MLQKRYAAWDSPTPEGKVPTFAGDGRFLNFRGRSRLVLEGVGADLGRWKDEQEMEGWMVRNREEIVQARREMIQALLSNNVRKAMSVRQKFQRKFGFPLTVTKQQLAAAMKLRQVPRPERILDRMPRDVRLQYARIMAASGQEGVLAGATARERAGVAPRADAVRLDPQTIEKLKELAAEEEKLRSAREGEATFSPFPGY